MTVMTVIVVSLRHVLPLFFLDETMKDASEIVAIASWLLLLGGTFFIADGVQTAMAGCSAGSTTPRSRCSLPRSASG